MVALSVSLVLSCIFLFQLASSSVLTERQYEVEFTRFMVDYNREYATSQELFQRFEIFKANLDFILQHNQENRTYTVGMNQFGDLTRDEFRAIYLNDHVPKRRSKHVVSVTEADPPAEWDWVAKGKVLPIQNQGALGNALAYAVVDCVASSYAIFQNGALARLSPEEVADCVPNPSSFGMAFQWVEQNKGICSNYPSGTGQCQASKCTPQDPITGYVDLKPKDEDVLKSAVYLTVVGVLIEADQASFQFYTGGVYSDPSCGTNLDHAVSIVGYGTMGGIDYWKVRNSWGTGWGMAGYILMKRNIDLCGIDLMASYVTA